MLNHIEQNPKITVITLVIGITALLTNFYSTSRGKLYFLILVFNGLCFISIFVVVQGINFENGGGCHD